MAGIIRHSDIEEVRSRVNIADVVGLYVQLKRAGMDSLVGLCPFHDEKTPSFHVRPAMGYFHCFGCGEHGDVITFVEKIENLSFTEAMEFLARRAHIDLHYEGGGREERKGPARARLIDAHRVAQQFYSAQLLTPQAQAGREFLERKGFTEDDWLTFGIGYAPQSWDALVQTLHHHGFTDQEIEAAGLVSRGSRGLYDRFRARLMWPIVNITNEPIGFGARKISSDDPGPKYLNTPETAIYHKSKVLYGLARAKKAIARDHRVVVVEGYTDVMAAQLAGVETAVATCGTAFGADHVKIVRRLMGDSATSAAGLQFAGGRSWGGEVIFTFDGDEAGRKAAMRAFQFDQSFSAQTFVAVAPGGMDPNEIRQNYGDEGVRQLVETKRPLFEFVIQTVLGMRDLHTVEGRAAALTDVASILASIKDPVLRGEYVRQVAGWIAMDESVVAAAVRRAPRLKAPEPVHLTQHQGTQHTGDGSSESEAPGEGVVVDTQTSVVVAQPFVPLSQLRNPQERVERQAIEIYLQWPWLAGLENMDALPSQTFADATYREIHAAISDVGGAQAFTAKVAELMDRGQQDMAAIYEADRWFIGEVAQHCSAQTQAIVSQLAAEVLPEDNPDNVQAFVHGIVAALIRQGVERQIADVRAAIGRTSSEDDSYMQLARRLAQLEEQRRQMDPRS
ncbi:MAG: DNA primase [Actinomycetaceae bacterium]|nr:DNA primase [Actinomycetaceae bacterium]MDY6083056.1 DNA primase [Actinomycetaceae bacterium]